MMSHHERSRQVTALRKVTISTILGSPYTWLRTALTRPEIYQVVSFS